MKLDEKALAAKAWADLEFAANATGALEIANVTLPIEKVRALVNERSALPSSPVSELTDEMVEAGAKAIAKAWGEDWECCCTERKGLDCDCGDAMTDDRYDSFDDRLSRDDCRTASRAALTTLTTRNAELEREVKRLRYIVHECANALGNGAYIDPNCSIEFMEILPVEIRSVVRSLSLSTSPQGGEHE